MKKNTTVITIAVILFCSICSNLYSQQTTSNTNSSDADLRQKIAEKKAYHKEHSPVAKKGMEKFSFTDNKQNKPEKKFENSVPGKSKNSALDEKPLSNTPAKASANQSIINDKRKPSVK